MSKMQYVIGEMDYMENIHAIDTPPSLSSEEDDINQRVVDYKFSNYLDINKILLNIFERIEKFFSKEGVEIGTNLRFSHFMGWIENYIYISDDEISDEISDDESE